MWSKQRGRGLRTVGVAWAGPRVTPESLRGGAISSPEGSWTDTHSRWSMCLCVRVCIRVCTGVCVRVFVSEYVSVYACVCA